MRMRRSTGVGPSGNRMFRSTSAVVSGNPIEVRVVWPMRLLARLAGSARVRSNGRRPSNVCGADSVGLDTNRGEQPWGPG